MLSYELVCDGKLLDVAINRAIPKIGSTLTFNNQVYIVKSVARALNEPAIVVVARIGDIKK